MKVEATIIVCFLLANTFLSGCATVTTGTNQSVSVITEKSVQDARCELTDKKGRKWWIPSTPGHASVTKGDGPLTIICNKQGYKTAQLMVDETLVPATFGNIILGGGIGIFVDAACGAAQQYPDQITVWMEPENFASDQERNAWLKEKEEFELAKKKKQQNNQTVTENPQ